MTYKYCICYKFDKNQIQKKSNDKNVIKSYENLDKITENFKSKQFF